MLNETKTYFDDTKSVADWLVAVAGACIIIWHISLKTASVGSKIYTKLKKGKQRTKQAPPVKISIILRIAIAVLLFSPYLMGVMYFSYEAALTAAIWFFIQGIIIILISSKPLGRFSLSILWFIGFLIAFLLHYDVQFGKVANLNSELIDSKIQLSASNQELRRSNAELDLVNSIQYTLGVELKIPPKTSQGSDKK